MTKKEQPSNGMLYPFLFVGIIWIIKAIEVVTFRDFSDYGLIPRTYIGLRGIFLAPLIHGNLPHLISNSLPLLILGIITFHFYRKIAFEIFIWVYLLTGICVWIVGENAVHVGASGIIYGFASFIFFSGIFRREGRALLLALLVGLVYGGIVWGILPGQPGVSWQYHLYGALTGALCAYYYRKE